ncbi:MAG TPA: (d)CMP kinase [Spirochaetota bacterium]|nr:(d)CMP kinase [Spirochaetota bacterium]HPI89679.1 (d)CMP kinase [Spirochaetota bacterium]HPR49495.1 (d)CMP kinase [Spirochaetota bacterium]
MKRIKVAVDGPAGSGKSSVAKKVASDLGLQYIDSGALYRSVTWFFLTSEAGMDADFKGGLEDCSISQTFHDDGSCATVVNGKDVSSLIRSEEITRHIGRVSDSPDVRNFVNTLLRSFSREGSVIMDGRDIGTVVFPDADLKIYLDASVDIRASRRVNEYKEMGKNVDENLIKKQIILRDEQDRRRPFGALRQADDALYVDTSGMTKSEVIEKVKTLVKPLLGDH